MSGNNNVPLTFPDDDGYTYRLVKEDEWEWLGDKFESSGYNRILLPHPSVSQCVIAEFDDDIVAFLFLQVTLHSEPVHIDAEHRGKVNWLRMLHTLESAMIVGCEYYAFAPNPKVEGMCRAAKMTDLGWKVFQKRVVRKGTVV